jgi:hypothetical protein
MFTTVATHTALNSNTFLSDKLGCAKTENGNANKSVHKIFFITKNIYLSIDLKNR